MCRHTPIELVNSLREEFASNPGLMVVRSRWDLIQELINKYQLKVVGVQTVQFMKVGPDVSSVVDSIQLSAQSVGIRVRGVVVMHSDRCRSRHDTFSR